MSQFDQSAASDPRRQRKCTENRMHSSSSSRNISSGEKSPMKVLSQNRTPGSSKTPKSKSNSGKSKKQPKTPKTPTAGDRFIPNRSSTQFDVGYYKIMNENLAKKDEADTRSPSQVQYQKIMNENLNGEILSSKIISYKAKPPTAPEGHQNSLRILYTSSKNSQCKKLTRHIPQTSDRILDAPEILDDYYLNLLDWSANNQLAVALAGHLYLWNAGTGEIKQLTEMESSDAYISSVAWVKEGNYLAVGTSEGVVELWDVFKEKRLRSMTGHSGRVGALSWNSHILSSGSRSGHIHHHDVRVAQHLQGNVAGHTQEVCGLRWSPDGMYLASGGNDNLLNIWAAEGGRLVPQSQPLYSLTYHQAAVKALAWCPWQPRLLASGGGTADRHIRFWNCNTGSNVQSIDTKSQVCAMLWSAEHRELISGHGYAQHQLTIWKYPSMTKVAELTGHTARILHLAMSPDGSTVVSAGADETLRLWKCFAGSEQKKKAEKNNKALVPGMIRLSTIR
ncbi:cell division cycle protein 20 homolog isoform X2 [Octopus sinensis]|uniref:Cell division cycle protein 20 homolog isoform X2 n=1 Tax=Octopus sinensis TaxID=2607531 RepID=A0A7E6FUB3_9MOLL|nr:cell division cycle protein 20 homolog isoform X2 [Octopus sinensis]